MPYVAKVTSLEYCLNTSSTFMQREEAAFKSKVMQVYSHHY